MCSGNQVEMSCKHLLTYYTERCNKGRRKPCAQPSLEGPRTYLADCCAACDPEFNVNRIKREHKAQHAKLVEQVNASQRLGRSEEVEQLLERISMLTSYTNKSIGEVRSYTSAIDVEFPRVTVPKGTSRWINGKCVWEEEDRWGLPPYRADRGRVDEIITAVPVEGAHTYVPAPLPDEQGYTGPPEEAQRQQLAISGPRRSRADKSHPGPHEKVVVDERQLDQQTPETTSRLLRTRRLPNGSTVPNSKRSLIPDVERAPRRPRRRYSVTQDEAIVDEDIWLQLAEKDSKDKASPRKIKARITSE
ncbi:hypothetical protein GGR52DRAFT_130183 [Hypoxylon sp. FL1284]|nr:hypothetical protein GGR52DRAFT_130183 [Hypoxylon sp. FL1284]